jgi:transcriptional regulator with XRE-family HTH domain
MALGAVLRAAREGKGLTPQQVAEATRMMVQIVEDLENEDFRKIAAPLYGRGFIKLYAECVGVDPEPLVAEFIEIFTGKRPPQILRRAIPAAPAPASARAAPQPEGRKAAVVPATPPLATHPAKELPERVSPAAMFESAPPKPKSAPEVMPLDQPEEDPPTDLFTLAHHKRPAAVPRSRSRASSSGTGAAPQQVLPFSGRKEADAAPAPLPEVPDPAPRRPSEPVWAKSRVVVREVARIWSGMPLLRGKWFTTRRLTAAAGIVAAVALLLLGVRVIAWLVVRADVKPVVSHRVFPPPPPYFE